ncbi:hypothetical protein [Halobacterium zhouii]|uniref:hypothetical protein n=1 Tax=Halobacterium zhouii TaxID=2902624 RepID=UPI001E63672D|nr:hypothetical protein [Halobacterium zhouii]
MSRQIRISIEDDEVFERLKRRKDALDLSWEDALRRGLRDSAEPPRGKRPKSRSHEHSASSSRPDPRHEHDRERRGERGHGERRSRENPSPFDPDFGERIASQVLSSVSESVPGFVGEPLDQEINRLEDAEDAELVLGEGEGERVPLRVALHTGADGLNVEVVAVRSGKGTEEMNRFADGARGRVARRFAQGETATLELDAGEETYDVRPELTWARGPDGAPTVTDVAVREVVFEES